MDVQNKVTIITGSSTGIGRATARLFAEHGAIVVLAARSADKLEALAEEIRSKGCEVLVVPTDVTQEDAVQNLVAKTIQAYGRIDILINNAGLGGAGAIAEYPVDAYRRMIEINLLGPYHGMQAVIPSMREQGGGLIINVSSTATKQMYPTVGPYSSTKHALNSLSNIAQLELAPENIRVVIVYPHNTASDFVSNGLIHGSINAEVPADAATPEFVAQKILEAAIDEPAEKYME